MSDVDANLKANSLSDHASNDNLELSGVNVIKNGSTTLFKLDTSGNLTVVKGITTTDGSLYGI